MSQKTKVEQLQGLIEETLAPTPFELVLAEFKKEGKNWVLRIYIDHEEGVSLEHCQSVTHLVSEVLETKDPIPHEYLLEVSSPGVDRPLVKRRDFERFLNERIFVKTHRPVDGHKSYTGTLRACLPEAVEIVAEPDGLTHTVPFEAIAKATLKPILNFD